MQKDTIPAAATGLPNSFRHDDIQNASSEADWNGAIPITPGFSALETKCPDAMDKMLLSLRPAWLASIARIVKATAECDGIQDRLTTETPKAWADLKIQKGDERYVRLGGRPTDGAYPYSADDVEYLRALLNSCPPGDGFYFSTGLSRQRGEAVVRGFDVVELAKEAIHARFGWDSAVKDYDAAVVENTTLRELILRHGAKTLAGLLFKAEVAGWCFGSPSEIEAEHIAGDNTCDAILYSILADLLRIRARIV